MSIIKYTVPVLMVVVLVVTVMTQPIYANENLSNKSALPDNQLLSITDSNIIIQTPDSNNEHFSPVLVALKYNKILSDIKVLNSLGLNDIVADEIAIKSGVITHSIEIDVSGSNNIMTDVIIDGDLNGDTELIVTESGISNSILLKSNGDCYIDGAIVPIYDDEANSIELAAQMWTGTSCPTALGPANVTYKASTKNYSDYQFTKKIKDLTTVAICSILGKIPTIGWALGLTTGLAAVIKSYADPNSTAISLKTTTYYNKNTKTFMINSVQGVQKTVSTAYSKKNYAGTSKTTTAWKWYS